MNNWQYGSQDVVVLHLHNSLTMRFVTYYEVKHINVLKECGGLVVEHQTPNREVMGSIPTQGIVLCS